MVTRNVVPTDNQAALLDGLVQSGRYQNVSEAMRAGLRLLELEEAEMADLRARITDSLAQADAGEFAEGSAGDAINRAFDAASRRYHQQAGK